MTNNQISFLNYKETQRHNVVTEDETAKHNRVTEEETATHNRAVEGETYRHNVATEQIDLAKLAETQRHNLETEAQGRTQLQINMSALAETSRHNVAVETETSKHNRAQEAVAYGQLEESKRHNQATEQISQQEADTKKYTAEAHALYEAYTYNLNKLSTYAKLKVERETARKLGIEADQLGDYLQLAIEKKDIQMVTSIIQVLSTAMSQQGWAY